MAMWGCAGQTIYDPDSKLSPPAAAVAGSHLLGPPARGNLTPASGK
jgi:hypothetical protein